MSRHERDLGARLEAVQRAVELGRGRCEPEQLAAAEALLAGSAGRRRFAVTRTVAALAGGTGSGKSSLFNAITGTDLAPTGVRRPTTSRARAAIWPPTTAGDADDVHPLLDWLDVPDRHTVADPSLAGLVLLDLPDFDSTVEAHRLEAERLTGVVDLLVWVLDPQKYADAAVHERYLRRLGTHRDVMLVVLNQVDRLEGTAAQSCERHLGRLLAEDGLRGVPILGVSARRGDGLGALRGVLAERARGRAAAVQRLEADTDRVAAELAALCAGTAADTSRREGARSDDRLLQALGAAAGVGVIAEAAGRSYRQQAIRRVGWPPTRWLARTRANPLRRLHLGPGTSGPLTRPGGSGGSVTGVQQAQVANAVRDLVTERGAGLPAGWRAAATGLVEEQRETLPAELDAAVRRADLAPAREPRWWQAVRSLQMLFLLLAVAGAGWLAVLAGLGYLQLPHPVPHLGQAPVPTVLFVGGLLLGLLTALLVRPFVAAGARRRAARARRSLDEGVRGVAERQVLAPLAEQRRSAAEFCTAVGAARR